MELTVLGANGTHPTATGACSGYLLQHEGFTLWMDAGNGTLSKLQQHVAIDGMDALLLSHVHPDHCADIYPFFYSRLMSPDAQPITVFCAPGMRDKLATLIGEESRERFGSLLRWTEMPPGAVAEAGPLRIESFDAAHSTANVTARITAGGRTLTYSGDTGPTEHLVAAARDADLFLCEASWLDADVGLMEPIHLRASEAGEHAKRAGAKRLVLTHVWPRNDLATVIDQAAQTYGSQPELAVRQERFTV